MNALRLCKIPSASHVLLTGGMEGNAKIWVGFEIGREHVLTVRICGNLATRRSGTLSTRSLSRRSLSAPTQHITF